MTDRGSNSRQAPVFCSGFGPILFGSIALACGIATVPAYGQQSAAPVPFDIAAQPLASALNAWAVQAGAQVFFEQAPVSGLTAPSVSGTMPPREALQTLLTHSGLEFIQNAEGAYVVHPAAIKVAHHHAPAQPVAATAPAAETPLPPPPVPAAPRSARDDEGPWEVRLRGTYLDPRHRSDLLHLPSTPATSVPTDDTRTDHSWSPELDLEYYFNSYWSTELALNLPRVHELNFRDSTYANGNVGDFRLAPNFLTFKYNFLPNSVFRPYIGAGINVTSFYDVNAGPFSLTRTTTGPAAQAGFDVHLSEHWLLNADVKWARVTPAVSFDGARVGRMAVDPVLVGVGIGYRFGGSPPPPPPVAAPRPVAPPPPPPDSDGDGVPDNLDQCPNTPPGVQVDGVGCPLDSDHDGVPDYLDKCPGTPPGLKVDAQGCELEELVLRGVNFKTNSAELEPESAEILDGVVAVLRQRPDAKAEIHGYTDSRGSDAYNLKLSERRAASVVDYLAAHGITREGLRAVGFGKDNPVASNDTVEGRAQNRRVTVQFSKPIRR